MNILLIFPLCPLPANSGGQVRVWNIAKQLSRSHSVDLICFIRNDSEKVYEKELLTVFKSVKFIRRRKLLDRSLLITGGAGFIKFFAANLKILFSSLFSLKPLLSHLYFSDELREYIQEADKQKRYNIFYAETFYGISSLKNILSELETPVWLVDQNVESIAYLRQSQQQRNPVLRALMRIDVYKIRREEEYFWNCATKTGALSENDRRYIAKKTNRDVFLLENGVDVGWFSQKVASRSDNEVLFVGSFSYFQNVDSLRWFLDSIWPKVVAQLKVAPELRIVGRGADLNLKNYVKEKGYRIDDRVDDIRTAFQQAAILVAPIRAGSGTKYKVIEAMASHLPVLTTPVGSEGLDVVLGKDILVAADEKDFIEKTVSLLENSELRAKLGKNGYQFVKNSYDWENIVHKFQKENGLEVISKPL